MQRDAEMLWISLNPPRKTRAPDCTQQDLCTSHSTSALPFLSRIFHHLSFFKPLPSSHAVPWFPLMHSKPALQLLCLFTPEPSPGRGPASPCVMLPCAQRSGVKPPNNLPVLAKPLLQPDPLRRSRLTRFGVWFFLLPQQLPLSFNF